VKQESGALSMTRILWTEGTIIVQLINDVGKVVVEQLFKEVDVVERV
jgi:hypothetical protein